MNTSVMRSVLRHTTQARSQYSVSRLVSARFQSSASGQYNYILTSKPRPGVAQITLNRPKQLNALSTPLFEEVNTALKEFDKDSSVGAIVITGIKDGAFAAGADIKEMKDLTFSEAYNNSFIELWSTTITTLSKPTIAAVTGYALGGGCELAMMTDIIYCSAGATFGQPEIKLGVIPGAGGSQRLIRAIGKAKAMDVILTGRFISGTEAEKWGLAAKVFDTAEETVTKALDTAATIAGFSRVAIKAAKDVVNQSQELSLAEGVKYERGVFHSMFATEDQKIGMEAFVNRKTPEWKHK